MRRGGCPAGLIGETGAHKNLEEINTVKPVLNDHIKQDIFLAFQTGGCLLLHETVHLKSFHFASNLNDHIVKDLIYKTFHFENDLFFLSLIIYPNYSVSEFYFQLILIALFLITTFKMAFINIRYIKFK